jgi:hypothetical protein
MLDMSRRGILEGFARNKAKERRTIRLIYIKLVDIVMFRFKVRAGIDPSEQKLAANRKKGGANRMARRPVSRENAGSER